MRLKPHDHELTIRCGYRTLSNVRSRRAIPHAPALAQHIDRGVLFSVAIAIEGGQVESTPR